MSLPLNLFLYCLIFLFAINQAHPKTTKDSIQFILSSDEFVEIKDDQNFVIDLRYAQKQNFIGQNLYGEFNRCYLHRIAAEKLLIAAKNLKKIDPHLKIMIFDALRPRSVQTILWNHVRGTPQENYVANPKGGSIHNFGFAIDLTLIDQTGKQLDMGTGFDDFSPLSQPQLEDRFLREDKLSPNQLKNRLLLRKVMQEAGFIQLPLEWWHFDALPKSQVRTQYKIVE